MKKTVQVTITVDDFEVGKLDPFLAMVHELVKDQEHKRVDVAIRDTPLIRTPLPGER